MGKWPSKDSFTSTLGKRVAATYLAATSAQPLHPEHREVSSILGEEDEPERVPLASRKVSD